MSTIAITAYNRPEYLKQVIESWGAADGIELWDMAFFVEPSEVQAEVAALCGTASEFAHSCMVTMNENRLGPLRNPFKALDHCFQTEQFVILGEDDSIVSPDILRAFEWVGAQCWLDPKILAVCAFQANPGLDPSVWKVQEKFHPTVWATWANRWRQDLRDTWDHDYSHDGWDWNINNRVRGDRVFVAPEVSRSQHIGEFGGSHCTPEMFEGLQAPTFAGPYRDGYSLGRRSW